VPEEIEKILDLTQPPAPQATREPSVSKSARFSRTCAFLALGSVMVFWLMMVPIGSAVKATGNAGDLIAILLVCEAYFLTGLSIAVAITAIMGLVGAKRHPGNRKVIVWALVLTFLAVAGFIVWFLIALSRSKLFF
jgi:hypothetical protein